MSFPRSTNFSFALCCLLLLLLTLMFLLLFLMLLFLFCFCCFHSNQEFFQSIPSPGKLLSRLSQCAYTSSVLLLWLLRFLLYSRLPSPSYTLPLELPAGFIVALTFPALKETSSRLAPQSARATAGALAYAAYEGVGASLGAFLSGLAYDGEGGARGIFSSFAVFAAAACLMNGALQWWAYRGKDRDGLEKKKK